jgi:hypothetical protein
LKNQSFLRQVVHQLFKSNLTFCAVCVFNLQFEKSVVQQLFISNLTFCAVCVFNLQFEKSMFLRPMTEHPVATSVEDLNDFELVIFHLRKCG